MSFNQDKLCSACQAGVPHSCGGGDGPHPDDRKRCVDCGGEFNRRSARLGSDRCPRCDRRNDRRAGR